MVSPAAAGSPVPVTRSVVTSVVGVDDGIFTAGLGFAAGCEVEVGGWVVVVDAGAGQPWPLSAMLVELPSATVDPVPELASAPDPAVVVALDPPGAGEAGDEVFDELPHAAAVSTSPAIRGRARRCTGRG